MQEADAVNDETFGGDAWDDIDYVSKSFSSICCVNMIPFICVGSLQSNAIAFLFAVGQQYFY
jgi:hypothetical protein